MHDTQALPAVAWRWQPGQMAAAADARSEISGADRLSEACLALALAACCLHDVFRSMLHCHAWLLEPWPNLQSTKAQRPANSQGLLGGRASPRGLTSRLASLGSSAASASCRSHSGRRLLPRAMEQQGPPAPLLIGCYSVFCTMYMLVSLVAPFFPSTADDWNITAGEIGFITACDPLGEVFAGIVSTWILAKLGNTPTAVLGMLLNAVSSVVFGVAPLVSTSRTWLLPVFVASRLANGFATTVSYVAVFTMLCALQPDKVGTVTATVTVLSSAGIMVGPLFGSAFHRVGGWAVDHYQLDENWQFAFPFVACSVLCALPTLVLWKARRHLSDNSHAGDGSGDAEGGEEEEEEISLSEEVRRMGSVLNLSVCAAAISLVMSCGMMNSIYPILGPHMEPRCTAHNTLPGEHAP